MNKAFLSCLASVALSLIPMIASSENSADCDSGAYEISGVLHDLNTVNGFAEAAVIVNGCFTFSNKENGYYKLRFKYLYPEDKVSIQIFNHGSRNHAPPLMPIGNGTIHYDATLVSETCTNEGGQ